MIKVTLPNQIFYLNYITSNKKKFLSLLFRCFFFDFFLIFSTDGQIEDLLLLLLLLLLPHFMMFHELIDSTYENISVRGKLNL